MDKKVDLVMGDKTLVKGVNCWLDRNTIEKNTYSINLEQIQPKKLVFNFRDGTEATYSLEENDGSLQKFLVLIYSPSSHVSLLELISTFLVPL